MKKINPEVRLRDTFIDFRGESIAICEIEDDLKNIVKDPDLVIDLLSGLLKKIKELKTAQLRS